ncbi:RNA-directed DNA polymerase from mobile element jockey [Trichonephila clavipes]|nr:RNA-directed DNA polymerase from mobile element jockey [Trichonephila clavipes]
MGPKAHSRSTRAWKLSPLLRRDGSLPLLPTLSLVNWPVITATLWCAILCLLYTAVWRPILTYGLPVWGYAAYANIKILEVAQRENSIIRNIVKADRYTNNSLIYKDIKVLPLKSYIQKLAISFFSNLPNIDNINVQSLNNYIPVPDIKRPRRILLDSYNPP